MANDSGKIIHFNPTAAFHAERDKEANLVGDTLRRLRKESKLGQNEIVQRLKTYGVDITCNALSLWERGLRSPNVYQFLAVCCALNVENVERVFRVNYRPDLNEEGRRKVREYRADLIATGKYAPVEELPQAGIRFIDIPFSELPVSAGRGVFLDENSFTMKSFPENEVPAGADFALRISGDSMRPVYEPGQIVFVQQCDSINPGEVGVFALDGEGFIKMYSEQEPEDPEEFTDSSGCVHMQPVLVSYNKKYDPRPVSPNVEFQIFGKVVK